MQYRCIVKLIKQIHLRQVKRQMTFPIMAATMSGNSTNAVNTRCLSLPGGFDLFTGKTEPTLTCSLGIQRQIKLGAVKVGPQNRRKVQLSIRKLPQEEITSTLFTPGAYKQIWIRSIVHA